MKTQEFTIEGMSCQHCVMAVKKELSKLNLKSYEVEIGYAKVTYDETKIDAKEIIKSIENAGYKVKGN